MPRLYICSIVLSLFSCGAASDLVKKEKEKDEEESAQSELNLREGKYWGVWEGTLKDKRAGSDGNLLPVKLTLNEDQTFKVESINDKSALVKGSYEIFSSSFIFKTEESNISIFSSKGQYQELQFTQLGKTLEFFSERISLKLSLKKTFNSEDVQDENQNQVFVPFVGTWKGYRSGRSWSVTIYTDNSFKTSVSYGGSVPAELNGICKLDTNPNIVNMSVSRSNDPRFESYNLKLILDKSQKNRAKMQLFKQDGTLELEVSVEK